MSLFPVRAFDHYWRMWNETDPSAVRAHLERAVSPDFVFCDPLHHHIGRDALEANVRRFRNDHPRAAFVIGSGVDHHHNRCRYAWALTVRGRAFVTGLDVATIGDDGLIERIDGFFGVLPAPAGVAVPASVRRS
jgi:hypothetical protein